MKSWEREEEKREEKMSAQITPRAGYYFVSLSVKRESTTPKRECLSFREREREREREWVRERERQHYDRRRFRPWVMMFIPWNCLRARFSDHHLRYTPTRQANWRENNSGVVCLIWGLLFGWGDVDLACADSEIGKQESIVRHRWKGTELARVNGKGLNLVRAVEAILK